MKSMVLTTIYVTYKSFLLFFISADAYDSISHWLDFNVKQSDVFLREETQQMPSPLGSPSRSNSKTALKKNKRKVSKLGIVLPYSSE